MLILVVCITTDHVDVTAIVLLVAVEALAGSRKLDELCFSRLALCYSSGVSRGLLGRSFSSRRPAVRCRCLVSRCLVCCPAGIKGGLRCGRFPVCNSLFLCGIGISSSLRLSPVLIGLGLSFGCLLFSGKDISKRSELPTDELLVRIASVASDHMHISASVLTAIQTQTAFANSLQQLGPRIVLPLLVVIILVTPPHVDAIVMTTPVETPAMRTTNELRVSVVGPMLILVVCITTDHVDVTAIVLLVAVEALAGSRKLD